MTGHTAQMSLAASELKMTGLHKRLGHVSNNITAKTAKFYGWKITGNPKTANRVNLPKPARRT